MPPGKQVPPWQLQVVKGESGGVVPQVSGASCCPHSLCRGPEKYACPRIASSESKGGRRLKDEALSFFHLIRPTAMALFLPLCFGSHTQLAAPCEKRAWVAWRLPQLLSAREHSEASH